MKCEICNEYYYGWRTDNTKMIEHLLNHIAADLHDLKLKIVDGVES